MKAKCNRGCSLLEVLTVISIIGVLTAILIPVVGNAMDRARKATVSSNLRQIAIAYYTYANSDGKSRVINKPTLHGWAAVLAEKGGINDPEIWIVKEDPLVQKAGKLPKYIASPGKRGWEMNEEFKDYPLSITVVNGLAGSVDPSTTPIAWTRGLRTDGRWSSLESEQPGIYGDKGGFIAYLDGHVNWYEDLNEDGGQLMNYITKKPTRNINEALPPHTSILDYRRNYDKNN